jgi:Ras-related GTP-binding protein C/D
VAHKINPDITFQVFIHKVDSDMFMQDEQKFDTLNEISQNMRGQLQEYTIGYDHGNEVQIEYHLTSIYDHTIYQALSKVI